MSEQLELEQLRNDVIEMNEQVMEAQKQLAEANKKLAEQQSLIKAMPKILADNCFGSSSQEGSVSLAAAYICILRCEHDHFQETGKFLFGSGAEELSALLAKAKEEGRAEAQARIKALEELATSLLKHAGTRIRACSLQYEEVMLNTSPTEALDKVVREAVEKERDEETVRMPTHWMTNIWSASQTLKSSDSILDRREGEALEVMYAELAEAIRRIEP